MPFDPDLSQIYGFAGIEVASQWVVTIVSLLLLGLLILMALEAFKLIAATIPMYQNPSRANALPLVLLAPKFFVLGLAVLMLWQTWLNPEGFLLWLHGTFPILTGIGGMSGWVTLVNILKILFGVMTFLFGVAFLGSLVVIPLSPDPKVAAKTCGAYLLPLLGLVGMTAVFFGIADGAPWLNGLERIFPVLPKG